MKAEEFNTIINKQVETCINLLSSKEEEYASGEDRLHNFKQAASLMQTSPEKALGGMMAKHTISVYDMVFNDEPYSMDKWDEKITDSINYLLLLKAVLMETPFEVE